jgi:phage tail sheath protein FI
VSFRYADPTKVQPSDIIGTAVNNVYSGIQNFLPAYSQFGFFPKILCVPGWAANDAVIAAVDSMAQMIRSVYFCDGYDSTSGVKSVQQIIAARRDPTNPFDTASTRAGLCYPRAMWFDISIIPTLTVPGPGGVPLYSFTNQEMPSAYSTFVAGAQSAKDAQKGYWWSVSSFQLVGVTGPEVDLYASPLDPNCDTNELNAQGIITLFAQQPGQVVWGNRSAAFPAFTTPDVFLCVRRGLDIMEDSILQSMLQSLDSPISNALITDVVLKANAFLHTLIQRGALVGPSSASYVPNDYPPEELAAGHVTFTLDVMPPTPAERLTFKVFLDTSLLASLGQTQPLQTITGTQPPATGIAGA